MQYSTTTLGLSLPFLVFNCGQPLSDKSSGPITPTAAFKVRAIEGEREGPTQEPSSRVLRRSQPSLGSNPKSLPNEYLA